MGLRVCAVVLLVLCSTLAVNAATYTVDLPSLTNTHFLDGQIRTVDVDFGQAFSSIDSVAILWEGNITTGYVTAYVPPEEIFDVVGEFWASFRDPSGNALALAGRNGINHFQGQEQFNPLGSAWDFLLDGSAPLQIKVSTFYYFIPGTYVSTPCEGDIYSASLVLTGTPVPEPSSFLALFSGFVSLSAMLRRRKP